MRLFFILILFCTKLVIAADFYWVSTSLGNWNDASNWSATSGGAGGFGVPGTGDRVFFNVNGTGNCNLNGDVNIAFLDVNNDWTGTLLTNGFQFEINANERLDLDNFTIIDAIGTSVFTIMNTNITDLNVGQYEIECNWISERIFLRELNITGTIYVEKSGANNDNSYGGNNINGNITIAHSGTNTLTLGTNAADVINGDLDVVLNGSGSMTLFSGGFNHAINGSLTVNNSAVGNVNRIYFNNNDATVLDISGSVTLNNLGTANNNEIIFGNRGQINVGQSLIANNLVADSNGTINIANVANSQVLINGDLTVQQNFGSLTGRSYTIIGNNGRVDVSGATNITANGDEDRKYIRIAYGNNSVFNAGGDFILNLSNGVAATESNTSIAFGGDAVFSGNVQITQDLEANNSYLYFGQQATSDVQVAQSFDYINLNRGDRAETFIGANGNIVFNGEVHLINDATANNNTIYLARTSGTCIFNENILIESRNIDADGIRFGDGGGISTLAATKTISIPSGGATNFIGGNLYLYNFTQIGNTAQTLKLGATANYFRIDGSNFGGSLDFEAPRFTASNSQFNEAVHFTKTGANADHSNGGNYFYQNAILQNLGSGEFTFQNNTADTFDLDLICYNDGSNNFALFRSSLGNLVKGNILWYNRSTDASANTTMYALNNANSSAMVEGDWLVENLASSRNANITLATFGQVEVLGRTQILNTASGTNSNIRVLDRTSTQGIFNGTLQILNRATCPNNNYVYLNNGGQMTCLAPVKIYLESSGNNANFYSENNVAAVSTYADSVLIYNRVTSTNSGDADFGITGMVTFNGPVWAENNATSNNNVIGFAKGASASVSFNENIEILSLNVDSDGIHFGENGGQSTLAANKTITIPGVDESNFIGGQVYLRNFIQRSNTAQSLHLGPTATYVRNNGSSWEGTVDFRAPRIRLDDTYFDQYAYHEKRGAFDDYSGGGNYFAQDARFVNSGSGLIAQGNGDIDTFEMNLFLENIGSSSMSFFRSTAGHLIGGNLSIENVSSAAANNNYIYISSEASSTLSINGDVHINDDNNATNSRIYFPGNGNLTCNGNVSTRLAGDGNAANQYFANGNGSVLTVNGQFDAIIEEGGTNMNLYLGNNGQITMNNKVLIDQQSNNSNRVQVLLSNGANAVGLFQDSVNISMAGSANDIYTYISEYGQSTFNGPLSIVQNGSANNHSALLNRRNGASNNFNHNVFLSSLNTDVDGFYFGQNGGQATVQSGFGISIPGTDTDNFLGGSLYFRNLNQLGSVPHNFELAATANYIQTYESSFEADVDFKSPRTQHRGSSFNGITVITKTGASNDYWYGLNSFSNDVSIINADVGTSILRTSNNFADIYLSNAYYESQGSNQIQPAFNDTTSYPGDITFVGDQILWGEGNGLIRLNGSGVQFINGFLNDLRTERLEIINTDAFGVDLDLIVNVDEKVDFTQGYFQTDYSNYLNISNNASANNASNLSHVNGPVQKVGNDAFIFPTGKDGIYQPIGISAPNTNNDAFIAEYFYTNSDPFYDHDLRVPSLDNISPCDYWFLQPTFGTSQVNVSLSWTEVNCGGVNELCELSVARWDGALWQNEGNGGALGSTLSGTVVNGNSCSVPTNLSQYQIFALASETANNPLPIELLSFEVELIDNEVLVEWVTSTETNNDYFIIERSNDLQDWELISTVNGAGNSTSAINYLTKDLTPVNGINYYRLTQVDFDGNSETFIPKSIVYQNAGITLYPNPTNGILHIKGNLEPSVKVFSLSGQLMMESSNNTEIDLSSFSAGIYFVQIGQELFKVEKY